MTLLNNADLPVEASIMCWMATICAWQGDWEGVLEAASRGAAVAERIEAVYIHAISRAFAGYAQWKLQGSDEAADTLAAAVACMADRKKLLSLSIAQGFLAEVEVGRGNVAAARRAVGGAFDRGRAGDSMGVAWAARAWAGHLVLHTPDRARVFLARARANAAHRMSAHEMARCDLVQARLGLCDARESAAMLQRACDEFSRMGMVSMHAEAMQERGLATAKG